MIQFVVDSSADYQMDELREKGLRLVPLPIMLAGETYVDGVNLGRDQFYQLMEETGAFPSTSQPSPQEFLDIFLEAKEKGDDVICILLSSELSGTCQTAVLAKTMAEYDRIYIVDSLTATYNIKVLTDYGLKLAEEGKDAAKITEQLEALKSHVKVVAALDTLEYLSRGGRINKTAAAIGDMAGLKPLITVTEDGKVKLFGKTLGRNRAIGQIIRYIQSMDIDENFPVYSIYSYGTENSSQFEERLTAAGITITERLQIGTVIGAHVGPEAFGIIFVTKM